MSLLPRLFSDKISFALYRKPGQTPVLVQQKKNDPLYLPSMPLKGPESGFIFAPFHPCAKTPIVIIAQGEEGELWDVPISLRGRFLHNQLSQNDLLPELDVEESFLKYSNAFARFSRKVIAGTPRLVLSRVARFIKKGTFSLEQVFSSACLKYPEAFISLVYTPKIGVWFGCSPEPLLTQENGLWKTTAVTGTVPVAVNGGMDIWSEKNIMEQRLVAQYVSERLQSLGVANICTGPVAYRTGNLVHLKTSYSFSFHASVSAWKVIRSLHPTPAVCGLPKEEAEQFILGNEGYDREYYSGFLGPLHRETTIYVNVRCMKVEESTLRLFAGGGIMPESLLEQTWDETCHKIRTQLTLL